VRLTSGEPSPILAGAFLADSQSGGPSRFVVTGPGVLLFNAPVADQFGTAGLATFEVSTGNVFQPERPESPAPFGIRVLTTTNRVDWVPAWQADMAEPASKFFRLQVGLPR
jgi:hypothetical protein